MSAAELPLREQDLDPDPLREFARWLDAARAGGIAEPEAMALATAGADGAPSARMVLLKRFDERGYAFFTNYDSRKGRELEENPQAALLFHWQPLGRQVRIEGRVARLERRVIEGYARSRSRESQLSALASPQSRPVPGREWLEERVAELARRHAAGDIPVGDDWGGFELSPAAYEFWQHSPHRLHDRFRYLPVARGGWTIERLGP